MSYMKYLLDDETIETIEVCPKCGKKYLCYATEQTPGFRDKETKQCPHCGHIICKSMEYEWRTYKL